VFGQKQVVVAAVAAFADDVGGGIVAVVSCPWNEIPDWLDEKNKKIK